MKKFFKNWSLLTISNVIQQGSLFFFFVLTARILQPADYGMFTFIVTSVTIAQVIASLGLQKIIVKEIALKLNLVSTISRRILLPLTAVYFLTGILLLVYFMILSDISNYLTLSFSFLYLLSFLLWNLGEPLAFGLQEMHLTSYLNAITSIFLPISILLIPDYLLDLNMLLFLFVVIHLIKSVGLIIWEYRRNYFKYDIEDGKNEISFSQLAKKSLPIYMSALLTIPVVYLPILFLGLFNDMEQVGFLGISTKISLIFTLVTNNLFVAIFPIITISAKENFIVFKEQISKIIVIVFPISLIFSLLISSFSPEIIISFLGVQYSSAIPVLIIQTWVALNVILHTLIGTVFIAIGEEKLMARLSLLTALVIGMANYYGAFYDAETLSIYTLVTYVIMTIIHWIILFGKVEIFWVKLKYYSLLFSIIIISLITYFFSMFNIYSRVLMFLGIFFIFSLTYFFVFNYEIKSIYRELKKYVW